MSTSLFDKTASLGLKTDNRVTPDSAFLSPGDTFIASGDLESEPDDKDKKQIDVFIVIERRNADRTAVATGHIRRSGVASSLDRWRAKMTVQEGSPMTPGPATAVALTVELSERVNLEQ
jgi:6-phosphofructokinase